MGKHLLSKSTFIRGMQCQKSLYLHKKRPFLRDRISPEQLAKFKRGTDVGVLARDLFPGGIDMSPKSPAQYQQKREETAAALNDPTIQVIYEAVVQYDDVLIMLDILVRDGDKWKAIEVKSSLKISPTYLQDASLQYYVLKNAGIVMADFILMYVNSDYTYNEKLELDRLFVSQSVIGHAESQLHDTAKKIALCKQTLNLQKSPEIAIGAQCNEPYPCDFKGHCWKSVPADAVLYTTATDEETRFRLFHEMVSEPALLRGISLNEPIERQLNALKNGTFLIDNKRLLTKLEGINLEKAIFVKALYYKPAVPVLNQTKPYQPIPLAVALSYRENNSWKTSSVHCAQDLSDWKKVVLFAAKFIQEEKTIVVFDDPDLSVLIGSVIQNPKTEEHLLDLDKMLHDLDFFFGNPNGLNTFDLAVSAFLPDEKLPKNEVWLRKDLLESGTEKSSNVLKHLEKYPQLMLAMMKKLFDMA